MKEQMPINLELTQVQVLLDNNTDYYTTESRLEFLGKACECLLSIVKQQQARLNAMDKKEHIRLFGD